jgi:hypothetical protein
MSRGGGRTINANVRHTCGVLIKHASMKSMTVNSLLFLSWVQCVKHDFAYDAGLPECKNTTYSKLLASPMI